MAHLRKQFAQLHENFMKLAHVVRKQGGRIGFEWPDHNALWREPCVKSMIKVFGLKRVRFDGCKVGLVSDKGNPILKPWAIETDCPQLRAAFAGRKCDKKNPKHVHDACAGRETAKTGNYTDEMASMIHQGIAAAVRYGSPFQDDAPLYESCAPCEEAPAFLKEEQVVPYVGKIEEPSSQSGAGIVCLRCSQRSPSHPCIDIRLLVSDHLLST